MADVLEDTNSLFDFVAKKGHGIKGLVDSGIAEVPDLYILPPNERSNPKINQNGPNSSSESNQYFSSVPIDLSKLDGPEHEQVAGAIVKAAETLGFFQVINHGVDLELWESMKDTAHRFFAKSAAAKAGYLRGSSQNPVVNFSTSFSPEKEKVLEWRDIISMTYTNDDDAEKYWPEECKKVVLEYVKLLSKSVRRLFEILIENLGINLKEHSNLESLIGNKVVNMNFYPPCPNPELTIGAGRHSDSGTLTVLLQDEVGGLHVKAQEEWIEIPPISGALVINVGDVFQIISNGKYQSAEHKVHTTSKKSRVSIPHFFAPLPLEKIGPLPHLVEKDGGTLYREVVFQDYHNNFFGNAHDGKNALEFAKINYV